MMKPPNALIMQPDNAIERFILPSSPVPFILAILPFLTFLLTR